MRPDREQSADEPNDFVLRMEGLPGFAWATDTDLRVLWMARPPARIAGGDAAAPGRRLFELLPMPKAESIARAAHRRAFDGQGSNFEFGVAGRTYEARVEPLREHGLVVGAVAMAVDVSDRSNEEGERRQAEAGFRGLLERVPAITYTAEFGATGEWRYVSPQIEAILGFTAEEWTAEPDLFYSRVHLDDRERYLAAEEAARTSGRLSVRYRLLARDGHVVWVRDDAVLTRETAGRPALLEGVMLDVTQQVRAEEALRDSEERYRRLVDLSPDAIFVHRDGEFVFANWAAAGLIGAADPMELVGLPILRIVHPDDRGLMSAWAQGERHGQAAPAVEARFVRLDTTVVDVEVAAIPFTFEGEPAGQIVARDVSRRKAVDRRLREAESRYRTLVETIPMVTYIVERGPHGRSVYVSPQIERLTGYTVEECLPDRRLWTRILHPEDRARVLAEDALHEQTEEPFSAEYRIVARDGRVVWIDNEAVLLRDDAGRASHWQGVMIDVTERKKAEEELRRALEMERDAGDRLRALDEMKNTFLHAVSHELRTPLSAVLGFALTLERADLDLPEQEARDIAGRIAANARKLERLLTDLLDLDRLDRGIVEPKLLPADLAQLVRRAVRESGLPAERNVELDTKPVVIGLDAAKVERIVENLVANSFRHTPARARVWVRVRPVSGGALLCVDDDGPGVPPELKETIFEPFMRGPKAPAHAPGVGVGLSLVGRFAKLHGGRAWVEDREGGGASFRVFLPVNWPAAG
ncbi:MAG: PAS domain S-box protein [Actinomycetota bacterium]